jgi:hypothetical protein
LAQGVVRRSRFLTTAGVAEPRSAARRRVNLEKIGRETDEYWPRSRLARIVSRPPVAGNVDDTAETVD